MKAELVKVLGSDEDVVDAARVSFDKVASNYSDEQNEKLIKYLAKHKHFSPFTHVFVKMRETVPIFVARQRFKHRIGFEYNEVSRRYVDDAPEFFYPNGWRKAAENKKQGSSDEFINDNHTSLEYRNFIEMAEHLYRDMIDKDGIAPEQARMVLPQSMYTSYIVTGSIAAWARAYGLRSDPDAQKEIQDLAVQWNDIISALPELKYSWEALIKNEA